MSQSFSSAPSLVKSSILFGALTALLTLAPLSPAQAQSASTPETTPDTTVETPTETPAEPVNPNAGHAYICVNASRGGLSLEIPGVNAAGEITGPVRLFRMAQTIRKVPADRITDYVNDGETISMKALGTNGKPEIVINTYENDGSIMPLGLVVQAKFKDIGMIAFPCRKKNASN